MLQIVNSITEASIIGVGAIGRQVAIYLTSLGVPKIRLVDFDRVELSNVASQGYEQADIGRLKVHAAADALLRLNPVVEIDPIPDRLRPSQLTGSVIFACVDSILARAAIWRACRDHCRFWCDGRMFEDVVRVLAVADGTGRECYETSLFSPDSAQGGACAQGGHVHVAAIAAGLMVNQFCHWRQGLTVASDITCNLLGLELVHIENASKTSHVTH